MRNAWIEADDLAEMMMRAFFSTSMDADAESYASRKEPHKVEYARIAIETTESAANARAHYLDTLAETHIAQRLLPGETLTIECGTDSTTTVRVALPPPEAAPTA